MNENKATICQTWIILMVAAVVVMGLHWGGLQNYLQQTRPDLEQPAWPDALLKVSEKFKTNAGILRARIAVGTEALSVACVSAMNQRLFSVDVSNKTNTIAEKKAAKTVAQDEHLDKHVASLGKVESLTELPGGEPATAHSESATPAVENAPSGRADVASVINPDDRFLFVGDSLMQGVAPHLRRTLCGNKRASCDDMSKPSTGLTYKSFYDWPAVVAQAFEKNRYSALFVFLGANDPWDFRMDQRSIRFRSSEWDTIYGSRVREVVQTARSHGAEVFWVGLPTMKLARLNEGQKIQNRIFAEQVTEGGGVIVDTHGVVDDGGPEFSRAIRLPDGRESTMRLEDGVHFTIPAQKRISNALVARFVEYRASRPAGASSSAPASGTLID